MENIKGKSRASFRWILSCAAMSLAASASVCFAQENENNWQETVTILATIIAAVSAIVAVIGAVIASRSAAAAMKSAFAAMLSARKKYGGTPLLPATIANQKIDWAKNFAEAIHAPFATVLAILFSIALGVGLNLLLPRSDSPSALVPASKPAVPSSTASVSAPTPPTSIASASPASVPAPTPPTSTASASPASVSAPTPPTSTAAASEVAGLLTRGRAYLSDGDVALARVFLRRAAERDDPQGALALAGTYDPAELRRLGVPNFQAQADTAKAREWYRRAAELDSATAASRLDQLSPIDKGRSR